MAGIYVHFPFCSSRCIYCDFYARVKADKEPYLAALAREIAERKDYLKSVPPHTVYFGGGTPSVFTVDQLSGTVAALSHSFDLSQVEEFTVEVNPDDVTSNFAEGLRSLGVNRISMGVQSFCDNHLQWMHRRHTAREAMDAFEVLQQAGFGNISIDLIFGYDILKEEEWDYNISQALALGAQHISCYQMMGRHASGDEQLCEREYLHLLDRLTHAGFEHYEVSNYALPGFRSMHNSAYWLCKPYLGLGPGAHSYDGERKRSWNLSDIERYVVDRPYESEHLSDIEIGEEELMLSLRTAEGIAAERLEGNPRLPHLIDEGCLTLREGRYAVPSEKMLILDWIVSTLL